jgi:hypothetical protein
MFYRVQNPYRFQPETGQNLSGYSLLVYFLSEKMSPKGRPPYDRTLSDLHHAQFDSPSTRQCTEKEERRIMKSLLPLLCEPNKIVITR